MKLCEIFARFCGIMIVESSRRSRSSSMETGGLPLMSTFALLTIVAGQLQGSGYTEAEPEFLSPLENMTLAQGRDIHFTCTVNHLGGYKVAWIKSDTKTILAIHTHMVTLNPRLSVTHNGHNTWKLYISNVEPKDSGTYMCQINTDPMMSQMGHLSVVIPPDIADGDGSDASAKEGGSVELHCSAAGVPEPTISWKRMGGRSIVFRGEGEKDKVVDSFVGSTLVLKNLKRADMGTYLCIAANGVPPTKSRLYEVAVHFAPVVKVVSPVVLRSVDMQVTLQCYVEAAPRSLNIWQRGKPQTGGKLLNSTKYVISEEPASEYAMRMNLTINRLKKGDFGEYSCLAVNGFGKADGLVILKETPQRTTTTTSTTTTTTTTTTTPRPTTTLATTRAPKRHKPKQHANQNALDNELRQVELNSALNFYNSAYATNNSQRTERQKIKPTISPRQYNDYISGAYARCVNALLLVLVAVTKLCM